MANWLAHPMEFGELPKEVEEIHREQTTWPLFDEKVTLSFHRYRMKNGFSSIGMTGPITWSFLGDSMKGFTTEELKRLYAGWYISFVAVNSANFSREQNKQKQQLTEEVLRKKLQGFVKIVEYLSFGDLVFYAYKIEKGNREIIVASDTEVQMEYEPDSKYLRLPPLYYFLGSLFFEGKL